MGLRHDFTTIAALLMREGSWTLAGGETCWALRLYISRNEDINHQHNKKNVFSYLSALDGTLNTNGGK